MSKPKQRFKVQIVNNPDHSQTHNYFDLEGNFIKSHTEQKPIHNQQNPIKLPEVVVTAENPNKNKNTFTWNNINNSTAGTIAGFIPGIGDAMEIGQIGYDLSRGNYSNAALGAGLFLLPGSMSTVLNKFKYYKNILFDPNFKFVLKRLPEVKDKYYHLDYGDKKGAFINNSGAYVKNNQLYPGKAKIPTQKDYTWWNKGKPYTTSVGNKPFNRVFIIDYDKNLLKVRDQPYSIGQWTGNQRNGRPAFVLPSEYVSSEPINLQNAIIYKRFPILNKNFYIRSFKP